jgi:hypothetical protein
MRLAAAVCLVFVTACASTTTTASLPSHSPTPVASASPFGGASPSSSPSPTPSRAVGFQLPPQSAPPAAPPGHCNLPVYWPTPNQDNSLQAGFMLYPGGTPAGPTLTIASYGQVAFYDRAVGRWLPVPSNAVSRDGLQLAYAEYDLPPSPAAGMAGETGPRSAGALATTGRVHLVDARTGADRVLFSGSPTYGVVGFEPEGIYLVQVALTMDGVFASGLYLLSLNGGTPVAVPGGARTLDRAGWQIERGSAWGVDYSTGGGITGGNELVQLNLHTGAVTVWLTKPEGTGVSFLGFDGAGSVLVSASSNGYSSSGTPPPTPPRQVLVMPAPQQPKILYQTTDPSVSAPYGTVYAEPSGAWFSGEPGAIWLDSGDAMTIIPFVVNERIEVGNSCG